MRGVKGGFVEGWEAPPVAECRKYLRTEDGAVVVYHGRDIVGLKRADMVRWHAWRAESTGRWVAATPEEVDFFEGLPLEGAIEN